ncbi:MAG TPA: protein-L-isoaspartate(D-aspartate) O-methyltransferase [Mucilaginibacter sp.]|jgi:protein-L-isoaspartate(D-aspartate) O-methyltransferase|nr:protein-L-isoaspartate(D-aspartate) O-methyltransferase [Mucilaginibacter sp.]
MITKHPDGYREQGARKMLVEEIKKKGIEDEKVLAAIGKVPRHVFFEETFQNQAYKDIAFQIGGGQTISQPFTVAYQTQLLHIHKDDKVLEIGTGSGYQTCILAELGAKVYTIERLEMLYRKAALLVPELGYKARFFLGDGSKGLAKRAPYDKIIVTAGAPTVPDELIKQLNIGGILVIPVGDQNSQKMVTILKTGEDSYEKIELDTFRFVPLVGDRAW